jgi:glycosyltransferase involved in cell wall biosynthesis
MINMMLSVCMITYNQEEFIDEAIESVLMQQTNFTFELVIGEDFSTDNTRKICEEYQAKYPKLNCCLLIKIMGSSRTSFGPINIAMVNMWCSWLETTITSIEIN